MRLILFPDGSTFNVVEGCSIIEVDDELVTIEEVEEAISDGEFFTLYYFEDDGDEVLEAIDGLEDRRSLG